MPLSLSRRRPVRTLIAVLLAGLAAVLLAAAAGWISFADDGVRAGRAGNARYREAAYGAAATTYERGLAARETAGAVPAALWNNLGLARHHLDSTTQATRAFTKALAAAPDAETRARAAYNAGTAAADGERDRTALRHLRQALLADPGHAAARFNFEVVKRRLDRREREQSPEQDQQPPPDDVQPSPFAERLKARADTLVARQRYADAYRIMAGGLQRDSTVRAFRGFIQRTGTIAQIDTLDTGGS